MPTYSVEKILPYTPKQLYDIVADIESYPKFLPWCEAAKIYDKDGDVVLADLVIHFRGIRGKYTSRVAFDEESREISVELAQGPFKHLYQVWKFTKTRDGTRVEFDIDFELRSKIMEKVMGFMFDEACQKMMVAFQKRAEEVVGA